LRDEFQQPGITGSPHRWSGEGRSGSRANKLSAIHPLSSIRRHYQIEMIVTLGSGKFIGAVTPAVTAILLVLPS
jgi:hypothetical protein